MNWKPAHSGGAWVAESTPQKGGRVNQKSPCELSVNKQLERQVWQQQGGDRLLPEVGQVEGSSPGQVSSTQSQKALQGWRTNSKSSQHIDNRGPAEGSLTLPQGKGARQRNMSPVNKHSEKPTLMQDNRWSTELISWIWGQDAGLSCHTSLRGGADHAAATERQKKKNTTHRPPTW
jgi:hypothetical protein